MDKHKLATIRNLALNSIFYVYRFNASKVCARHGIFIDKACIEWGIVSLRKFDDKKLNYLFGFNPLRVYELAQFKK